MHHKTPKIPLTLPPESVSMADGKKRIGSEQAGVESEEENLEVTDILMCSLWVTWCLSYRSLSKPATS